MVISPASRSGRADDVATNTNPDRGALAVLHSCSAVERRALKLLAIHLHVDRGQVICEAGDFGDELFVILDGAVVVQAADDSVTRLGAGDAFGEMAPLARTPRRATVTAFAPTTLLVFRRREFAKLLDRAPRVGRALLRAASTRVRSYSADSSDSVEVDA